MEVRTIQAGTQLAETVARCAGQRAGRHIISVPQQRSWEPSLPKDGVALMEQVFALADPVLLVPPSIETESDRSEQLGYGNLMKGVVGAFRNPRSHDVFFEDDPLQALLIIELVQHLLEVLANARLVEKFATDT